MGIKITLATGETHSLPFDHLSTLTVTTSRVVEPTVVVQDAQSFTDVAAVEVVADVESVESAVAVEQTEDVAPVDPPVAAPSSDTSSTDSSEPQTTSTDTTTDNDPAHDQAVAQAAEAVQVVTDAKPKDRGELVALAAADIDSALAQWPDSPALLDAKTQLDLLAGA